MSNGLSSTGFIVKSSEEILLDLQTDMKDRFGETYALEDNTQDGAFLKDLADLYSEIWDNTGNIYNSLSPVLSADVSLSKLVQFNGITRDPRRPTNTLLTITGLPLEIYSKGLLVNSPSGGDQYVIIEEFIVDITGSVRVEAEAVEFDTPVLPIGTLTVFDTISPNLYSVTNLDATILGNDIETDMELKSKRESLIRQGAVGTNGAVESALNGITNMRNARVLDNPTNSTDVNGIDPHGVVFIVAQDSGISSGEIAIWEEDVVEAILTNKSMNSPMNQELAGFVNKVATNAQNKQLTVQYHLATEVPIYIKVTINTDARGAFFPPDGPTLIKQAIIDYSKGELIRSRTFNISEDVNITELFSAIYSVSGFSVVTLQIDTTPVPTAFDDIVIGEFEISEFSIANIEVNIQ